MSPGPSTDGDFQNTDENTESGWKFPVYIYTPPSVSDPARINVSDPV